MYTDENDTRGLAGPLSDAPQCAHEQLFKRLGKQSQTQALLPTSWDKGSMDELYAHGCEHCYLPTYRWRLPGA